MNIKPSITLFGHFKFKLTFLFYRLSIATSNYYICVNVCDRVCMSTCPLSSPDPLEVWKHEWYSMLSQIFRFTKSWQKLSKKSKTSTAPCSTARRAVPSIRLVYLTNSMRRSIGDYITAIHMYTVL